MQPKRFQLLMDQDGFIGRAYLDTYGTQDWSIHLAISITHDILPLEYHNYSNTMYDLSIYLAMFDYTTAVTSLPVLSNVLFLYCELLA